MACSCDGMGRSINSVHSTSSRRRCVPKAPCLAIPVLVYLAYAGSSVPLSVTGLMYSVVCTRTTVSDDVRTSEAIHNRSNTYLLIVR